jgi:adenine-specific DNA-methyltransferase
MEKLKMQSPDKIDENLAKIAKIFPHVITESKDQEGNITKAIDFDLLKQSLSSVLVEDDAERYRLDWPGKKASLLKANSPINKTLRPCREESVNFDTTENLYLEGDNFEVLKILQESYLNKVKMIYIDPPYNTGKDFVYTDKFKIDKDEYEEEIGVYDEEGGRLFKNTDTNGRFHSDWLSMMYERLIVARDLLKEDGVIFISIDDNEVHNLRKICDEVFGEENFVASVVRRRRQSQANLSSNISAIHEHLLIISKSSALELNKVDANINIKAFKNNDSDPRGPYVTMPCTNKGGAKYSITTPTGRVIEEEWRFKKDTYQKLFDDNRLVFPREGDGKPRYKLFLEEKKKMGVIPNTWWDDVSSNQEASKEIKRIFKNYIFDTPKPIEFIIKAIIIGSNKSDIILDFFSGSATTAHAVMQLNAEDGGKRKFIMVQLPEKTDEKSEAYKAGYETISDIGKERIRRAGKQILEELKAKQAKLGDKLFEDEKAQELESKLANLDIGFRVYKTDSSNMKDVYYHPNDYEQMTVDELVSNTKEDRSPEDLLTQVILDLGLELNLPIEKQRIKKNDVYFVLHNSLVACFDDELDFDIVDEIAKVKPLKVVFKDSSFKDDKDRINLESRFKRLSPDTAIKVL